MCDADNPSLLRPASGSTADNKFFDGIASQGLSQVFNVKTRNHLDLIYTDIDSDLEVHTTSHSLKLDSHHHASIELTFVLRSLMSMDEEDYSPMGFDFRRAGFPGLKAAVSGFNW